MKLTPQMLGAVGAILIGAFCVGWLAVSGKSDSSVAPDENGVALPSVRHDGEFAGEAGERFASLDFGRAPTPETTDQQSVAPPPPPPDIAVLFRRDLTAIEQTPQGLIVWIVDLAQFSGRRGIRAGGVYQDGWRVSAISAQFIELRKRREVRRVATFEAPRDEVQ